MDLDQAQWLINEGRDALTALEELEASGGKRSTKRWTEWQVNLLREQLALRRRSSRRFPDPTNWLWTQRSLAQASDWWCARYKASLFPADIHAVDGCCGAGVDLVALRGRGPVFAIDRDPVLVALANANLAAHGFEPTASVGDLPADLRSNLASNATGAMWLHLDPDRRAVDSVERRLRKAEDYSPSLQESLDMARDCAAAMIKLAPASIVEPEVETAFRSTVGLSRCWLGNLGECRQQLLLTGKLASANDVRSAVLCEPPAFAEPDASPQPLVIQGPRQETVAGRNKPLRYIYDCHAVLHASQLTMCWGERDGAEPLGTSQGYFTSDAAACSPWAQCFEVLELLPWDQRRVKRWLREHRIGEVEVKKRLLQLDANECQRQLRGAGTDKITLLITRLDDRVRAIVARRIQPELTESSTAENH